MPHPSRLIIAQIANHKTLERALTNRYRHWNVIYLESRSRSYSSLDAVDKYVVSQEIYRIFNIDA